MFGAIRKQTALLKLASLLAITWSLLALAPMARADGGVTATILAPVGGQLVSTVCNDTESPVQVGIASYQLTDKAATLVGQVLFDFHTVTLAPHTCQNLSVNIPPCGYQADVFTGDVIFHLSPTNRYGSRILTSAGSISTDTCDLAGRMTGGGSVFTSDSTRVTHGFELHCDKSNKPNNLEVNFGGGNNFHLDTLARVFCAKIGDVYYIFGVGTGSYNGVSGATVFFRLTDAGEPGTNDEAYIVIKDSTGATVLSVNGFLDNGNQQFHLDKS
jgi:hypothetical protein